MPKVQRILERGGEELENEIGTRRAGECPVNGCFTGCRVSRSMRSVNFFDGWILGGSHDRSQNEDERQTARPRRVPITLAGRCFGSGSLFRDR